MNEQRKIDDLVNTLKWILKCPDVVKDSFYRRCITSIIDSHETKQTGAQADE